jgi:hypothetical protein
MSDAGEAVGARERAARVIAAVSGERPWEREEELDRLRTLPSDEGLVEALVEALRDPTAAERRNGARSALAALASRSPRPRANGSRRSPRRTRTATSACWR